MQVICYSKSKTQFIPEIYRRTLPGVKQLGREVNHSSASDEKGKDGCNITCILSLSLSLSVSLSV
jgi:hypothetical protein